MRAFAFSVLAAVCTLAMAYGVSRATHAIRYGITISRFDVGAGEALFRAKCARCHSIGGGGRGLGPDLARIGAIAGHRRRGVSAEAYLLESILQPRAFRAPGSSGEMPSNLVDSSTDEEVLNLVAYLSRRGANGDDAAISQLAVKRPKSPQKASKMTANVVLRGEEIFRGNLGCATCHGFYASQGVLHAAPFLFYQGYSDSHEIRRSIVAPHEKVAQQYRLSTVVLTSGKVRTGVVLRQDERELVLMENTLEARRVMSIPLDEVEVDENGAPVILTTTSSSMPLKFGEVLSEPDLDAVVAFILALN